MATVKIYKVTCLSAYQMSEQGTGYSLRPWGRNTVDYEGYDDGGRDYILPDGYSLAEGNDNQPRIYDAAGEDCPIITYNNCPAIVISAPHPRILKKA